jgi:hypothetical protein
MNSKQQETNMQQSRLKRLGLAAGLLVLTGNAPAALVDAGNGLVNDTVLNITWVADASLSGARTWDALVQWAEDLVYGGYDDWRLASMSTSASTASAFDCSGGTEQDCINSGNELGYMFHYNIVGSFPKTGDQTVGDVTLTEIQSLYWSGTESASDSGNAWGFLAGSGFQGVDVKGNCPGCPGCQAPAWQPRPLRLQLPVLPPRGVHLDQPSPPAKLRALDQRRKGRGIAAEEAIAAARHER